jgi:hypothetical protein
MSINSRLTGSIDAAPPIAASMTATASSVRPTPPSTPPVLENASDTSGGATPSGSVMPASPAARLPGATNTL